jgi:hypothetical protein
MGSESASGWNGQIGQESIGKDSYSNYLNGQLYFLHIFKSSLTLNDRAIVEGGISPTGDCAQQPLRATSPMICLMHPLKRYLGHVFQKLPWHFSRALIESR